jgi:hypothetical protein
VFLPAHFTEALLNFLHSHSWTLVDGEVLEGPGESAAGAGDGGQMRLRGGLGALVFRDAKEGPRPGEGCLGAGRKGEVGPLGSL